MMSLIGSHTEQDKAMLARARAIVGTYGKILAPVTGSGPTEGSLLGRLSRDVASPIELAATLTSSVSSAIDCCRTLSDLTTEGRPDPSPWVIAPLSRAALIGAARVLYVLLPATYVEKVANAQLVSAQEPFACQRAVRSTRAFTELGALQAPADVVDEIDRQVQEKSTFRKLHDTDLVQGAAALMKRRMEEALPPGSDTSLLPVLDEQAKWMWHTWSGISHGFAWPQLLPNAGRSDGYFAMPGHWVADFTHLAALSQQAAALWSEASTGVHTSD